MPPLREWTVADLDGQPDPQTCLQPDLLVLRQEDVGVKNITVPFRPAVEVISPAGRRKDLLLKRSKYQDEGVASYWVVDPDQPSLTAFDLVDGHYRRTAEVHGDQPADLRLPFPIRTTPSDLVLP